MATTRCLINQPTCGRVTGNPVCPKCGMDERVVYPDQADLDETLKAGLVKYNSAKTVDKSQESRMIPNLPKTAQINSASSTSTIARWFWFGIIAISSGLAFSLLYLSGVGVIATDFPYLAVLLVFSFPFFLIILIREDNSRYIGMAFLLVVVLTGLYSEGTKWNAPPATAVFVPTSAK